MLRYGRRMAILRDGTTACEHRLGWRKFTFVPRVGAAPSRSRITVGRRFFVGNVIAVDEVAHCFIEMAFAVLNDCQQCRQVTLKRAGGKGNSVDEMEQ